ncbi:MAG: hybrid sensor histidine kinase/response regulator, partial [Pseudopedobacter saltans]
VGTRIGIFRYYPIKEKFRLVCGTEGEVTSIHKDATGMLWFISANTLTRFSETQNEKTRFTLKETSPTCICSTPKGEMYIGTSDGLIAEYKGGSFVYFNLFKNSKESAPKWIERLYPTTNNKIMVGLANYGIKSFDCIKKSYEDVIIDEKNTKGIYARDFLQVSNGKIWIATESGIFVHDNANGTNTKVSNEKGNGYSLSDNAVYTLCLDKEGGIWAGTYSGGINYFNPKYSLFTKYFPQSSSKNRISGNVVREICPDKFGNIWIGTEDAGLNKLELKNNSITTFSSSIKEYAVSYPNIHGLLAIGKKLLIGTFEHGLDIMDIPSGVIEKHFPNSGSKNKLRSQFIVTLFQSKDSTIYVGTRSGLYNFSLETGEFTSICPLLQNSFIHTLTEDVNGKIWIGTMGNGLFTYNPKNKTIFSLSKNLSSLKNPGTQWITTVFQSKDRSVWIGTEGCGLIKQNSNNSLESYSINEDFPGATIYKILEDDLQNLWITTSGGLVHFNPKEKKILGIYTTSNGLLSNQFNYNSGYKGNNGTMYFGSVKGMVSFNPKEVQNDNFVPPIYISGITTGRTKIQLSPSQKAFPFDPNVKLNSEESTFSIEFAALSFVSPEMMHYRYRMKGLNDKWIYTSLPKAFFTSLPKGTYEFEVEVASENGKWIGNVSHLNVKVFPPFWQSNFAYTIYVLLMLTLIFFIIRSYRTVKLERIRRIAEHENFEREKESYHNKLSFLTSIAHEIRTPLTLIKAPLEKILKQVDELPNIQKYLFTMQRNTDRMITLSEELLDFRKTEIEAY